MSGDQRSSQYSDVSSPHNQLEIGVHLPSVSEATVGCEHAITGSCAEPILEHLCTSTQGCTDLINPCAATEGLESERQYTLSSRSTPRHTDPINPCSSGEDLEYEHDDFWKALDRRSDEFWRMFALYAKDIPADPFSVIVTGPDNLKVTLESDLQVGPVEQIEYQEFMRKVLERDKKLRATIELLRSRCENMEEDLADAKEEAQSASVRAAKSIKRIRDFWRTKIYGGQTRSGRLVRDAVNLKK